MDITIRLTTVHDFYDIARLFFEGTGRVITHTEFRSNMVDCPNAIAILDNKIVGFACTCVFSPDIIRLDNLFVKSELRNQGIGAKLIAFLENNIPLRYRYIILDNSLLYEYYHKNLPPKRSAREFYERLGFEPIIITENTVVLKKELHR
jgi:GNAT superfamily N-acetyltransferase